MEDSPAHHSTYQKQARVSDEIEYRPLALATAGALAVGGLGCLSWMGCVWLVEKHPDMAVLLIHVLAVAVFSLTAWISSKPKMRVWR